MDDTEQRLGARLDAAEAAAGARYDRIRAGQAFAAIGELVRRWDAVGTDPGEPPRHSDLARYELRCLSQNGEDGAICEILRRTGISAQPYFIEFGAADGSEGCCIALADVLGWRGLLIEAEPELSERLSAKYGPVAAVTTIAAAVTPANVTDLFVRAGAPAEPDVLSIDVDGDDYWIWEAIERHRPRLVVIEVNASIDPELLLVQEPGSRFANSDHFGASLGALVALGERKGYRLVHIDIAGVNAFFVRGDLGGSFPAPAEVRRRGPNYHLASQGHAADTSGRRYVDLSGGR